MNEFLLDPMITTQNTSGLRFDDVVAAARAQAAAYRKMNTVNILADGGPTRPDYAAMAKVVTNRNKDKNFVQRALNPDKYPHLTDDKGNNVTHLMTWSDNGESMDIYPTVVYDNGKLKQLDDYEAFEYAMRNNERINIPISDFGDWYSQNGLIEHKEFAKGGGLSRSKDYGSKKKPYPSVKSGDFAGGGRSYPIPTKADAVDALRLAGLHHRADVKAKVYRKYPSLKHAEGGLLDYSQPILIDQSPVTTVPDNPNVNLDLMWKNNQSIGNNRKMNMSNMEQIDNYLVSKNVPLYQRQAILYTILQESGADALDAHGNGYYGLVGWSVDRYNSIKDKSLLGQAEYLYDTLYNGNGTVDWNHGGDGSGYNSWKDARKAFVDAQDFNTALKALTYGYVRPAADVKTYRLQNGSKHF